MSVADEIQKLHALHASGALSEAEFEQAKAKILYGETQGATKGDRSDLAINRLRLSNDDKWLAGVCGGIAEITGVDSWIWRLIFVLGLAIGGFTAVLYIVLWIFVPRDPL